MPLSADKSERSERLVLFMVSSSDWDTLPNRLTLFRIVLVPFALGALAFEQTSVSRASFSYPLFGYIAAGIFTIAAITDILDGIAARRSNSVTTFGSFLDPIADKFLVISSLILLQSMDRVSVFITVILVLREVYITSLRLLASERGLTLPVEVYGKLKTVCQMVAIPLLMAYDNVGILSMPMVGTVLLYVATVLSLFSAVRYSLKILEKMRGASHE